MLNIKNANVSGDNVKEVVAKAIDTIKQDETKLVIFFSSTKYDFETVSKMFNEGFKNIDVIGCTTSGEIGPSGFCEGSISAMSIAADDFQTSTYIMKNIKTRAMVARKDLNLVGEKIGFKSDDSENGFIITLIDGMQASEEKVMNTVGSCYPNLPLIGGSAGDDLQFKATQVSANGEVYENAAVITFVKTNKKVFLYKENIYVPTDIEFKVTQIDVSNRAIVELNGRPAAQEYAKALGVTVDDLPNHFMKNPLGRVIGDSIFITAPREIIDGDSIAFYSLTLRDATVKLLKPIDAIQEAKKTVEAIKAELPNCKGVILFNCILRYLQFKNENICKEIAQEFSTCGTVCGFNTYGEQLNKLQVSQTLTLIALGE
jgi:hypothetical protein